METFSFIGSDKNAGKTTAFNYVYRDYQKKGTRVCLTSIGINGETTDSYDGEKKPFVTVFEDSFFITACEHLEKLDGRYEILTVFPKIIYGKDYLLGKALLDTDLVIEGPNTGSDVLKIKRRVEFEIPDATLLIDGSIDRMFLGNPDISDGFYFSLLISERKEQERKAKSLLDSLKIPEETRFSNLIREVKGFKTRSMILSEDGKIIYKGETIPFMDIELKERIKKLAGEKIAVYINGSLTKSFYGFLKFFKNLVIIIDNFTQYQNISISESNFNFNRLYILNRTKIKKIFLNEKRKNFFELPCGVPVQNIFRQVS